MKLKLFQKQDLARAALHDGLILSWDTGLGKTWAMFLWPMLKAGCTKTNSELRPAKPVLIVAPGDLHQQIADEAWTHFRIHPVPLDSQEAFMLAASKRSVDGRRGSLDPAFYITSYTQLTTNGVQRIPDAMDCDDPVALLQTLALKNGEPLPIVPEENEWHQRPDFDTTCEFFAWRGIQWKDDFFRLSLTPQSTITELTRAFERETEAAQAIRDTDLRAEAIARLQESFDVLKHLLCARPDPQFRQLAPAQQNFILRHFLADKLGRYEATVGTVREYAQEEDGTWQRVDPRPETPPGGSALRAGSPDPRPKRRIECIYSPSLADLCHDAFACVVVDEGVKMKGEDTYVGQGVRKMNPPFRLVLTATPVKNRLPDIFRLAWWASGGRAEAHARFPYRDDPEERAKFAATFMVSERNVTREKNAEENGKHVSNGRFKRLTAEVCNIHRLWKLLGPIVLRRRKQDCGEEIVDKIRRVVRCEMGTLQQQVYQYHLEAKYLDIHNKPAVGAQLQALRIAAADPASAHLVEQSGRLTKPCECTRVKGETPHAASPREAQPFTRPEGANRQPPRKNCSLCHGTGEIPLPHRSGQPYIPKMASTLTLIEEILARKEQVIVFSAFNDPLDNLSTWLTEAGVRHVKLDGRVSQKRRGVHAAKFKQGRVKGGTPHAASPTPQILNLVTRHSSLVTPPDAEGIPVMLAGVECMAEGHSFHLANNVILVAYSWAYDKFIQALSRVHRMNSAKPVNVYVVICQGTIDRRLESLIQDKGDAAELVLDGRLIGERTEEVNLAELLKIAHKEFDAGSNTIDEALLQAQWLGGPSGIGLRDKLRAAMAAWDLHPVECGTIPQGKPAQLGMPDLPVSQTLHRFLFQERGASDWKIMPGFTAPAGQAAEQVAAWNKSDRHGRQWKSEPTITETTKPKENTTMNGRRNTIPKIQPITPPTAGIPPTPLRLNSAIRNPPVPPVTCHPSPVTPASPVNDWRARLRARVAAIEKTVPADIGSQL
jgi:hypothetical protein